MTSTDTYLPHQDKTVAENALLATAPGKSNPSNADSAQTNVVVLVEDENLYAQAEELACHLHAQLVFSPPSDSSKTLVLKVDEQGLSLIDGDMHLHGDYVKMYDRIKPGKLQKELLVKAAKIKKPNQPLTAIDATAGLGQDGLLLAAAGFSVTLYEKDPIIAALLKDCIARVKDDHWLGPITQRMTVIEQDSVKALQSLADASASVSVSASANAGASVNVSANIDAASNDSSNTIPDVVLLDPMFPKRRKSASVKKKFQVIHQLEKPCENEEELLQAALGVHPKKIIIKRPAKGPHLGGIAPTYSLEGKAIRYDVIALPPR